MKPGKFLGIIIIIVLAMQPVIFWLLYSPEQIDFSDYSTTTHNLGELFGLVGMTLFAITFVLSTRIKLIEDLFDGLDKVYIVHAIVGSLALVLVLFHPIFLVLKFIPQEVSLAARYLLPSDYWSVNFGIIALLGLIFLLYLTLYTKMRYNIWKFSHEFLGLIFIFAVLHIFLVVGTVTDDGIFTGYYAYAITVSLLGLSAFFYSLFLKSRASKNAIYKISSIAEHKDVFEIKMQPEHKPISYKSGQFIFVRFYNKKLSKEAHPFSIASKSDAPELRLVIKKLGDFTSNLVNLKQGDKVSVEGPYGRFNYRKAAGRDQVWLAGGIGITPFLGMAEDLLTDKNLNSNIYLFYSAREESDLIGYNILSHVSRRMNNFHFIPWTSNKQGYLTADHVLEICKGYKDKEFFICGPPAFKDSIISSLLKHGVRKDRLHEEAFDFR